MEGLGTRPVLTSLFLIVSDPLSMISSTFYKPYLLVIDLFMVINNSLVYVDAPAATVTIGCVEYMYIIHIVHVVFVHMHVGNIILKIQYISHIAKCRYMYLFTTMAVRKGRVTFVPLYIDICLPALPISVAGQPGRSADRQLTSTPHVMLFVCTVRVLDNVCMCVCACF